METAPTTVIVEYNPIAAALATVEKYRGLVCDVTTPTGMAEAKVAQREVGALRIALEKTRKKVKEEVVARGKLIDGEANRIFSLIAAIEDPIKKQIEAEEERVERERQAAIEAEEKRLAEVEAARKRADEEKLATERAALARERAAFDAEQKKREEEDRARRAAADAEAMASRKRIEAEEAAAMARLAEQERLAREVRHAEEARLNAERDRLAAERRAAEEAEAAKRRAEQEVREAAEREARRLEAEKQDSRAMLVSFCTRFGKLHPELAQHIRAYLEDASVPA